MQRVQIHHECNVYTHIYTRRIKRKEEENYYALMQQSCSNDTLASHCIFGPGDTNLDAQWRHYSWRHTVDQHKTT